MFIFRVTCSVATERERRTGFFSLRFYTPQRGGHGGGKRRPSNLQIEISIRVQFFRPRSFSSFRARHGAFNPLWVNFHSCRCAHASALSISPQSPQACEAKLSTLNRHPFLKSGLALPKRLRPHSRDSRSFTPQPSDSSPFSFRLKVTFSSLILGVRTRRFARGGTPALPRNPVVCITAVFDDNILSRAGVRQPYAADIFIKKKKKKQADWQLS